MHYELEARTRQGMEMRIEELKTMLKDMQQDFAQIAAKATSPCFFCAKDETCQYPASGTCEFKWKKHN